MSPIDAGFLIGTSITAIVALVCAIYAASSARRNRREQDEYTSRTPTPPTTQEVWTRLDSTERKLAALVRILHEVANQWPSEAAPPRFDRGDLDVLDDTMPPQWRRRYKLPPPKRPPRRA